MQAKQRLPPAGTILGGPFSPTNMRLNDGGEGGIRVIVLSDCFIKSELSTFAKYAPFSAPKFIGVIRTDMDKNGTRAIDDRAIPATVIVT